MDLELYDDIDVDNSKSHHSPRGVDLVLRKKEAKDEYWPRFLKETKKVHFLKTDFDKVRSIPWNAACVEIYIYRRIIY